MSLRYDVNFNRRALEARNRLRWMGVLRTALATAYVGTLVLLVGLYALLASDRHRQVQLLAREAQHVQQASAGASRPVLTPAALEMVMAAKASPVIWLTRLRHLAKGMPDEGVITEFVGGDASADVPSPVRYGAVSISGKFPVPQGEASLTRPLTKWMDGLQADTTFRRGLADLRLESSRVVSEPRQRSVEFKIVAR